MSFSCRPFAWRSLFRPVAGGESFDAKVALAALSGVLALALSSGSAWAGVDLIDVDAAQVHVVRSDTPRDVGTVALDRLPIQAQDTDRLIRRGGPFPYPKDGVVFGNRERVLPREARGYYHEYTVPTPGSRDRGARRIVCGGNPPSQPHACYYTDDHYQSFRRITP